MTDEELSFLRTFTTTGIHHSRELRRAHILLHSHAGWFAPRTAEATGASPTTVYRVRRRYCTEGLLPALQDKPRPGPPRRVTPAIEAQLTALVCSSPPVGYARWTIRLLRDEAHRRFGISLGRETIRLLLKEHQLKPWKKRVGASPSSPRSTLPG
ncbi:MAG: helix-turn-helix domain-containing protein [Anaerolineales bacterium]